MDLIRARFGNVPVLAKKAAHVAACRAHAENTCARQKMIQGLFLDGIDLQSSGRSRTPIGQDECGNAADRDSSGHVRSFPAPTTALRRVLAFSGGSLAPPWTLLSNPSIPPLDAP